MDYLPIFVDVRERLIVVIGGGAVAARKVELLLKAHARVRVIAPLLHAELVVFRDAGRIEYYAGRFNPVQLEGAALVIAATDDEAVNDLVACTARDLGIWANVVDDTARSAFIFPAIVDRSPVIVAVGTEGHSPTLSRRVRAQIEALLPERLGELATLAGRWRGRVRDALSNTSERLRFWEAFFSGPVATQVLAGRPEAAERTATAELERASKAAADGPRGEVYLIGAGPGDPDLLTLRAQQLLQQADVILHDRLVSPQILARARRDAQRVYVGKAPGEHCNTQQYINEQLVAYAKRGLRVAR
ncbi:MAG: NAD(P)-dependent oxidoreductase, partial [Steroidobacteraceae bacterium]